MSDFNQDDQGFYSGSYGNQGVYDMSNAEFPQNTLVSCCIV